MSTANLEALVADIDSPSEKDIDEFSEAPSAMTMPEQRKRPDPKR